MNRSFAALRTDSNAQVTEQSTAEQFVNVRIVVLATALLVACHSPQQMPAPAHGATDVGTPQTLATDSRYIPAADRRPGVFPPAWRHKAGRAPTFGSHAMVASDAPLGSAAGVEILRKGGNAVDAAVAVGFAIAVAFPEAGNIGGGGYMVIHMADGRSAALDYREIAPLAATRNMYLDANGKLTDRSIVGPTASGVPGAVAGLTEALAKYGTMRLADVMAPAIRYAEEGFVVDSAFASSVRGNQKLLTQFGGAALLLPGGTPLAAGSRLTQPALAKTLRAIAAQGRSAFYEGAIAESWTRELRNAGGIITMADLQSYKPVWREAVKSTYRGYSLLTMPPSSSGGVTITETMNILEGFDSLPAYGSAGWAHVLGSAYQRAFIDRNEKLADPAFVAVPISQLTDKKYAASLRATIGTMRATPTST
ncbi:MAG: hypothetical protein JWM95_1436, partial [Gemmatimonadetes bacterium]|nr:hypothetical protein [Gemmatimonadota bacterium]